MPGPRAPLLRENDRNTGHSAWFCDTGEARGEGRDKTRRTRRPARRGNSGVTEWEAPRRHLGRAAARTTKGAAVLGGPRKYLEASVESIKRGAVVNASTKIALGWLAPELRLVA